MGQIILSTDEIISILQANALVPHQVRDVRTAGEEIKIRVKTSWPLLKSIPVGMRFAGFEDGCVILQVATNVLTDKFSWLVDRMLESFPLADYGGRWEYPRLYLDINRLIQDQVRGVTVKDVTFEEGLFYVTTAHVNGSATAGGPQEEDESDDSCAT